MTVVITKITAVITKITVVITKMTMVVTKMTVVIAKTTVVLDVTPCSVGGHAEDTGRVTPLDFTTLRGTTSICPTAGHYTSRIASSPADENTCKSPVFAATSVLFVGSEYDMHVKHETVCYDNISIYILHSRTRPFVKRQVK
jgi:hypothetical protein